MAFGYYAGRGERLALRFEAALERTLRMIADAPLSWPMLDDTYRFCPLRGFPYHVVYRMHQEKAYVVAVAHGSRDQAYWRSRLKGIEDITDEP